MEIDNSRELVKKEAVPIATEAKSIVVRGPETLAKANEMYLMIDQMRRRIKEVFNPIVEKAKEAKKKADEARAEAVRQWEKAEEPLVEARAHLDRQIVEYKREQDRKRAEEEERLRQKAMKEEADRRQREEDRKVAQAEVLSGKGLTSEADALIEEAILARSEPMIPNVPPPKTERIALEGMTTVTTWRAEVFDLRALCHDIGMGHSPTAYVVPDMGALNKQASSLKKELRIPGVRAVSETKTRPTGR